MYAPNFAQIIRLVFFLFGYYNMKTFFHIFYTCQAWGEPMQKFQGIFAVNHRAFMLIELIIVMLMMAFLSIFILTRTPAEYAELAGESETLRSRLRYVRNLALADDNDSWRMEFTGGTSCQLVHKDFGPVPFPGADSLTAPLPVGYTAAVARDDGIDPGERISFDRWGAPAGDTNYSLILLDTDTGASETVRILKHTGFIQ